MLRRFDVAQLPETTWKNGGGSTREVARWPLGAKSEEFDWRVSIALIESSGPFSVFAGIDRLIMLLAGDGVQLHGRGIGHRLDVPLQPFHFNGGLPIDCTPLGGASSHLNVMSRRSGVRAEMRVLRSSASSTAAPHGLLLALRGYWRAGDEFLGPQQGLWWAGAERTWPLQSSDVDPILIAIAWHPAAT